MQQNYNICLTRLLKDEGGYTDDPSDSGGATNYGITIADYRSYIDSKGSSGDVKAMSIDDAKYIYKTKYWDALDCDSLSNGVDYTVFDYGVNSGLGRPRKALQRFKSLEGIKLIDAINDERVSFLRSISAGKNAKFLNGWLSRVSRVRAYSKSLAQNNIAGPTAGTATVGIFAGISQFFHTHETTIILSGILSAIVVGTGVHIYKNRKTIWPSQPTLPTSSPSSKSVSRTSTPA